MNIVTPVTQVTQPAPSAFDPLVSAEAAAWDAYEASLAVAQEVQDSLVAAGSSVRKAYDAVQWRRDAACNALDSALAVANAVYEDALTLPVPRRLPVHEVTGLLESVHGLTVRYYKRDTCVITVVADDAACRFADSDPATQVACYPDGRTVYTVAVCGWTVRFEQFGAPLPPAKPIPVGDVSVVSGDVDALSLSELEAAMLVAPYGEVFTALAAEWQRRLIAGVVYGARVVTGDDGLDHYL